MSDTEKTDLTKLRIRREGSSPAEGPRRSGRTLVLVIGTAAVLAVIGWVIIRAMTGTVEIVRLTTVSLVSPSQANAILTASGYVVAQRKASIASKATGRLVYLAFGEGARVREGEVIARIESADVEAALMEARAGLRAQKAELHDAEQSFRRAQQLFEGNLISSADHDAVQARRDRVVASIEAAEAAVRAAEVQVENTFIRAPFDGTILTKNADVGEVVAPFGAGASSRVAVVTMADMSSLQIEADVSESNIEKITVNQPCEIVLDAYPDRRYRGAVGIIVPTADRAKATVLTKIRFLDKDKRVLPEMSAKVHFLSKPSEEEQIQPRLAVDALATITKNGSLVAYLVRDGEVKEVPIETGERLGAMIEIRSGLSSGDRVVLSPSDRLTSGTKVQVKD